MILYQLLIQLINMNQEQPSYEINNDLLMNLYEFQNQYFKDQFEIDEKFLPATEHTQKIEKQVEWMNQGNQETPFEDENSNDTIQKKSHLIEFSLQTLIRIQKSKKGRPKQAKNINQIFKNQILNYLSMLMEFKIFSQQTHFLIKRLKQKSFCQATYIELLECKNVHQKLYEYYLSPQILRKILLSERLTHSRKIQIIKHYNIVSKIINQS